MFPIGTCTDLKWNLNQNLRKLYELNFDRKSLKISRTLDFDEIWLARSWLHLIASKNIFLPKEGQNFEFHSKRKFGLIS
jgi:hypothetical protein